MDNTLTLLNGVLSSTLERLKTPEVNAELHKLLHNHDQGVLPDTRMSQLASETVDLVNQIEQILEPGHLVLADHYLGYVHAKCLVGAVELNVADHLRNGPLSIDELARVTKARPDRLYQILRVLSSNGIFSLDTATRVIQNNHTSSLLVTDHWAQWHNWVTLYGNQFYDMAAGIPASLKEDSKRFPAQIVYDTDDNMFTYFNSRGWVPQLHKTLGAGAKAQAPGIVADYPWSEIENETVIDIGGGGGGFLATILRASKKMQGGIFDLPHVIDHAKPFFLPGGQFEDVGDRVKDENLIGGDFFKEIPPSKVYTMKWTLHDWREEDSVRILKNIEKAIIRSPNSRLVILESVLDTSRSKRLTRYGDMNMFIAADGLERTWLDWKTLAEKAGWEITKHYPLRNAWHDAFDLKPKSWFA